MDAVELNYLVDVGSESFGGDRVSLKEPVVVSQRCSIDPCSSLIGDKDGTSSLKGLEFTSCRNGKNSEVYLNGTEILGPHSEDVSKRAQCGSDVGPAWNNTDEEVKVHRRAGRVSRSGVCPKRPRIALLEDSIGPSEVDDTKELLDKKQKNHLSTRRGDRRNFKVATKSKHDSFSIKGFPNFSSNGGPSNIYALPDNSEVPWILGDGIGYDESSFDSCMIGTYGLKTDIHDITKYIDDLSLKDLLDGNYPCPSFNKDKAEKIASATGNIMISVRKACSVIQPPKPPQSEQFVDVDSCSDDKMPICSSGSQSIMTNDVNGDHCCADLSSSIKNSCKDPETLSSLLENPFNEPKDTLQLLALPLQKDLESLLQDASKPSASSKNALDLCKSKQMTRRASLPLFSWSQYYGHCRTNSDSAKLLTSRSSCQGRWVRTGKSISRGIGSDDDVNIESLTYDTSLVPSLTTPRQTNLENNTESSKLIPCCEVDPSVGVTSLPDTVVVRLGSTNENNSQGKVERCSRLLAAAQTLCAIASDTSKLKQAGTLKWPKKSLHKVMKARKLKPNEKPDELILASSAGSHHVARGSKDCLVPAKRPKLTSDNRNDLSINGVKRSPVGCSKSRLSPKKSVASLIAETKHSTTYTVKQSYMMPRPAKVAKR